MAEMAEMVEQEQELLLDELVLSEELEVQVELELLVDSLVIMWES